MLFSYEARDAGGQTVTGSLDAADERTAASVVRDRGYYVMRLTPEQVVPHTVVPVSRNPYAAASTNGYKPAALMQQEPTLMPTSLQEQGYGGVQDAIVPHQDYALPQREAYAMPVQEQYAADASVLGTQGQGVAAERTFVPPRMTAGRWIRDNFTRRIWTGVSPRDLALFYRQFAALVGAGVTVRAALDVLAEQSNNGTLRRAMWEMRPVIESGGTISDAMSLYPWLFRDDHRALIVAGEMSGGLDLVMRRIADALDLEVAFRGKLKGALTEPLITLSMTFLLPPLFMVVVQGNLTGYLETAVLPIVLITAAWLAIWVAGRVSHGAKSITDMVLATFPGIGGTARLIALARFCRSLGALYRGGVNVPTAVHYASLACGNVYMAGRLLKSVPYMQQGHGMLEALQATRVLPPVVLSMIGVGETTGDVDTLMDKIAEHFEQESVVRLHQTAVSIRVAATILIGIIVGYEVIKFYTGYYSDQMNIPDN